ncbi:MAG: hypothetical protein ABI131_04585 [Nostocoides sp.]
MGFYIKDLYVHRIPKVTWHDPLTNPPTIPETSPIIRMSVLSPQLARVARGSGGGTELPADDTTLYTIPTPITPIVFPAGRLEANDLQVVRENLVATLKAVDTQLATMQPSAEDLAYVRSVVKG